jgi:NADPH:quinone reductase-like Zn-dependent oxidoreductase
LTRTELPDPSPSAGEVLVRLRATSLGSRDIMVAEGRYAAPTLPIVPSAKAPVKSSLSERGSHVGRALGAAEMARVRRRGRLPRRDGWRNDERNDEGNPWVTCMKFVYQ